MRSLQRPSVVNLEWNEMNDVENTSTVRQRGNKYTICSTVWLMMEKVLMPYFTHKSNTVGKRTHSREHESMKTKQRALNSVWISKHSGLYVSVQNVTWNCHDDDTVAFWMVIKITTTTMLTRTWLPLPKGYNFKIHKHPEENITNMF